MKKIKLLAPILGLSTIASAIVPTITSCSNNGHVWLSTIQKEETQGNAEGTTFYFGLDTDKYETKDLDVQVVSENKDEFNVVKWNVSRNVVSVTVKYIGNFNDGDKSKVVNLKLRFKTADWSKELEVTGNFLNGITIDEWIIAYTKVYDKVVAKIAAEEAGEIEPIKEFDPSEGDYSDTNVFYREHYDFSPKTVVGKINKSVNPSTGFIILNISWIDKETKQEITSYPYTMMPPDYAYDYYKEIVDAKQDIRFFIESDGNVGVEAYYINPGNISQTTYFVTDINGLKFTIDYLSNGTNWFNYNVHFNNYRPESE